MTVSPSTATVQLFGAVPFGATWKALDGQPLNTTDSVHWSVNATLANVTQDGRVLAEGTPGVATLQARVRNTVGTASITIVDDSLRALYTAPVVAVTQRFEPGYVRPGPLSWVGDITWMTVSASAMSGASITSAILYVQNADGVEYSYDVPVDEEFEYWSANVYVGGFLIPYTVDSPAPPYRLVVTDSHGLVTEVSGPTP